MPGMTPEVGMYNAKSLHNGFVSFAGSFQGNSSSDPASAQYRGSLFSVALTSTGIYTVTLTSSLPYQINAAQSWPDGLLMEPRAWIVSETAATEPVKAWLINTTKYSSATFRIYCRDTGNSNALTNVTTADRVFFALSFKCVGAIP